MSGHIQNPTPSAKQNPTSGTRHTAGLRETLFAAACDVATEAEIEAAIDAALAPYDNDPEPPMIGFRESPDEDTLGCPECVICRALNAEYGDPKLVPLPDGTILEIRRRREANVS